MPQPLDYTVIHPDIVASITAANPISKSFLTNYLESRPGILDYGQCDIFERNCRTDRQCWADFSLFRKQPGMDKNTVIIFPFWLELFEADDKRDNISRCIDFLKNCPYPKNPIVIQWNHDRDAATVPELQNLPENFFVLQFNTSKPTPNDIVLPFWAIETQPPGDYIHPTRLAGFTGNGGPANRRWLRDWLAGRPDYFWSEERLPPNQYFLQMRESHFALCPRGGGLGSYRMYEAIQCQRPPVIFSDSTVLPFSDSVDWMDFALLFPDRPNISFEAFDNYLRYARKMLWGRMQQKLEEVRPKFSLLGVQQEIHKRISEFLK